MPLAVSIFLAAVVIIPDLPICLSALHGQPVWTKVICLAPTLVGIWAAVAMHRQGLVGTAFTAFCWIVLTTCLPKLVFDLFYMSGLLFGGAGRPNPTICVCIWCGVAGAATLAVVMLWGLIIGWRDLSVQEFDLYFSTLPDEFEGFKVAQISDLHLGSLSGKETFVQQIVDSTLGVKPDLVVFTGDLVNNTPDEIAPFEMILSSLANAPEGVVAVLGNHDYDRRAQKGEEYGGSYFARRIVQIEEKMGWKVLLDSSHRIRRGFSSIVVCGVENIGTGPFPSIGNLEEAMESVKSDDFTILLSHDPWHWADEVSSRDDIALTLSGHTHGGQFRIGKWSPFTRVQRFWSGMYQKDGRYLYVSDGIGGRIRFRFGARPQIAVFRLHRRQMP